MSENLSNYLNAVLEIEIDGEKWIGKPSQSASSLNPNTKLPQILSNDSIVVTAWNPEGKSQAQEHNRFLNNLLEQELRESKLKFHSCIGRDESNAHFEESFLVECLSSEDEDFCLKLAKKCSQEAVFKLSGSISRLIFIDQRGRDFEQILHWKLGLSS